MNYKFSFTWDETLELRRALNLITNEDGACDVNMSAEAVAAKASALAKLTKVVGKSRLEKALETATAVDVRDLRAK